MDIFCHSYLNLPLISGVGNMGQIEGYIFSLEERRISPKQRGNTCRVHSGLQGGECI